MPTCSLYAVRFLPSPHLPHPTSTHRDLSQYNDAARTVYTNLSLPVGHIFLDDTQTAVTYKDIMPYKRMAAQFRGHMGLVLCRRKDHGYVMTSFGLSDTDANYPAFGVSESFALDSAKHVMFTGSNYDDLTDMDDKKLEETLVGFGEAYINGELTPKMVWYPGRVNGAHPGVFTEANWGKAERNALVFLSSALGAAGRKVGEVGERGKGEEGVEAAKVRAAVTQRLEVLHKVAEVLKMSQVSSLALYKVDATHSLFQPSIFPGATADPGDGMHMLVTVQQNAWPTRTTYKGKWKYKSIIRWAAKQGLLSSADLKRIESRWKTKSKAKRTKTKGKDEL